MKLMDSEGVPSKDLAALAGTTVGLFCVSIYVRLIRLALVSNVQFRPEDASVSLSLVGQWMHGEGNLPCFS